MSNVQDEYRASHYYMSIRLQKEANTHPLNSHSMLFPLSIATVLCADRSVLEVHQIQ